MNNLRVHLKFMGRYWSLPKSEFLGWLERMMEINDPNGAVGFVFVLDGWREIKNRPKHSVAFDPNIWTGYYVHNVLIPALKSGLPIPPYVKTHPTKPQQGIKEGKDE
ncbi:hypothetical protein A3709_19360 [Halioglobus sp. HI00S01]|uniref:hypothetical protein n=1 Tax=Halioglobus sp. HI00S01 TaxID=1822214 RepID=UPI0007C3655D|nr:hypothetical protein [Halioglobus sp. HI00S01]KZX57783.1 hypothetical protein A3709_19360 [Halioglobus sp. HI00S01]